MNEITEATEATKTAIAREIVELLQNCQLSADDGLSAIITAYFAIFFAGSVVEGKTTQDAHRHFDGLAELLKSVYDERMRDLK